MRYHLTPDLQLCPTDKFTDSAIAMNSKVNGEHKEKVLQRWEGGDSNSDDYDLESDMVQSLSQASRGGAVIGSQVVLGTEVLLGRWKGRKIF